MNSPVYFILSLTTVLLLSRCQSQLQSPTVHDSIVAESAYIANSRQFGLQLDFTSMIYSIYQDNSDNYWFGSDKEGLCRFDGQSMTYYSKSDISTPIGTHSHNQIRAIQEDEEGTIWFETGDGISCYRDELMSNYSSKELRDTYHESVTLWPNTTKGVWLGNGDETGGVYRAIGDSLSFLSFPLISSVFGSSSIKGPVTATTVGAKEMVWIASYTGVIGYNGSEFTFINEKKYQYHVRSLFEDSRGTLWIGNNGIGVLRYENGVTSHFTKNQGLDNVESMQRHPQSSASTLNHVFAIAEDHKGNIWFGDRDTGAWKYDGVTLKNYTMEDGLTSNFVRAIYCDRKGNLLLGMSDGSVCRLTGNSFEKKY